MTDFVEDRSVLTRTVALPADVVRYGDLDEHRADVRKAINGTQRPLVVLLHGGFWRPQFDRTHTGPMCEAIAASGWTVASIEYRRIPGNPDATLNDVSLAISQLPILIKQHSGKAIVVGHSAGGHLALWTAAQCQSPNLIGALALGPAADLHYAYAHAIGDNAVRAFIGGPPSDRRDLDPTQMPSTPIPVTIIHGALDAIAPIAMSENYLAKHPNTRLVRIEDCGHFATIDPVAPAWTTVVDELERLS